MGAEGNEEAEKASTELKTTTWDAISWNYVKRLFYIWKWLKNRNENEEAWKQDDILFH